MKRGAYNKSFVVVDGTEVYGLKRRPNQGRFYAADCPFVTFGKDPVLAIVRFAQWRFLTGRSKVDPAGEIKKVKKKPSKRRVPLPELKPLVIPDDFMERKPKWTLPSDEPDK